MSEATSPVLQRAYELIESGRLPEARELLDDYLLDNPDDTDAWWLYVHAVDDQAQGREALERLAALDPNYPGLSDMRRDVSDAEAGIDITGRTPDFVAALDETPSAGSSDAFDDAFDFDSGGPEPVSSGRRRLLLGLVALLVVAVAIAAVIALTQLGGGTPQATQVAADQTTATPQAAAPTVTTDRGAPTTTASVPTATIIPPTDVPPTEASGSVIPGLSAEQAQTVTAVMADLPVVEDSSSVMTSSAGETFVLSVCSSGDNRSLRETLPSALGALSGAGDALSGTVEALGIRLEDCEQGNVLLRYVVVDIASASEYAAGNLDETAFAARWEPQPLP